MTTIFLLASAAALVTTFLYFTVIEEKLASIIYSPRERLQQARMTAVLAEIQALEKETNAIMREVRKRQRSSAANYRACRRPIRLTGHRRTAIAA